MKIRVFLESIHNEFFAEAYYEDGAITVLPGGYIRKHFASHIRGGKTSRDYRDNPEYVSDDMTILKECSFSSPSTAAQFVTGRSTNGYDAWKVEDKKSLNQFLKELRLK